MNGDESFALLVAVGEAIANAVEHAYGDREPGLVEVRTTSTSSRFTVQIDDYGRWRPFQRREERGRGIPLMHALVDGVQIKSTQTSTSITLSIDRKPQADEATA
jgi:anti-sigma regulatory factor (Ser/Thr protein kinase)